MPKTLIDTNGIMNLIPHRYPFLLMDRVIELEEKQSITALKNVTANEEFFVGHFPHHPVMPGVLIVEALAQTSAVLISYSMDKETRQTKVPYFSSIKEAKFLKPVIPGDVLWLQACVKNSKMGFWIFDAQASVGQELVAQATITAVLAPANKTHANV